MSESFPEVPRHTERDFPERVITQAKSLLLDRCAKDYYHSSGDQHVAFAEKSWEKPEVFAWYVSLAISQLHAAKLTRVPSEQLSAIRSKVEEMEQFLAQRDKRDNIPTDYVTPGPLPMSTRRAIAIDYVEMFYDGEELRVSLPQVLNMLRAQETAETMLSDQVTAPI